ncbi:MAG: 2-amino-4-hydroxy-6-hydroxymethyldihydropteridine diphosphokinase [Bacillota bacterium]
MSRAYLGIGSNIGDREANIVYALKMIEANEAIEIIKKSYMYETEPVGYKEQDWFYNIVVEIKTSLKPYELLDVCSNIEAELKRERLIRWGPRIIDVDILLYDDLHIDEVKLTIPHPRMTERAFVMVPLYEIADDLVIHGQYIADIIKSLKGERIRKIL